MEIDHASKQRATMDDRAPPSRLSTDKERQRRSAMTRVGTDIHRPENQDKTLADFLAVYGSECFSGCLLFARPCARPVHSLPGGASPQHPLTTTSLHPHPGPMKCSQSPCSENPTRFCACSSCQRAHSNYRCSVHPCPSSDARYLTTVQELAIFKVTQPHAR